MAFGKKKKKRDHDDDRQESKPKPLRIALLAVAAVLMVLGAVGPMIAGSGTETRASDYGINDGSDAVGAAGLTGESRTSRSDGEEEARTAMQVWGPALFRLGLSFIVGFVTAFLIRSFLMWAVILGLVVAAIVAGLHFSGIYEFDGSKLETAAPWAKAQFESAKGFVLGYVPSAAACVFGFGMGIRK